MVNGRIMRTGGGFQSYDLGNLGVQKIPRKFFGMRLSHLWAQNSASNYCVGL